MIHQACLETFFGLGLIVGPTLGGLLFQIGGYILPFAVLGGVLILASCLTHFLLPDCYYPDVPHGGIVTLFNSILISLIDRYRLYSIINQVVSIIRPSMKYIHTSMSLPENIIQL